MEEKTEAHEGKEQSRAKRKRSAPSPSVEPRTPLKRQRVPVQKFQSPAEEIIPIPSTSKARTKEDTELIHKKGSFLAVRGDEGSFYLCRTAQNFFSNTRKFKIQWLDLNEPPSTYKLDFLDSTDADCVLTNIKMERVSRDTFRLPQKEQDRVEEILAKSLKKERGEPVEDLIPVEDEEESDEEWEDEPSPPPKKSKKEKEKSKPQPKSRKAIAVPSKGKSSSKSSTKKSKDKDKKSSKQKEKDKKKKKEAKEKKKGPDRKLKPNPKIKVLEKDPFFETKDKVEFISKNVHGKLAIRAVLNRDMKLMQSLMEDKEEIYRLDGFRSVDVKKNALHYALEQNNHEAIKLLVNDFFKEENPRLKDNMPQHVFLHTGDTGSYNPMSLGIRNIRAISQSRGSREGNDAFTKDEQEGYELEDYVEDALKLGVTSETLEVLMTCLPTASRECLLDRAMNNLYQAVLCGNRKLAGYLIGECEKAGESGFNFLHKEVLLFEKEELRQTILSASVKKKPWANKSITPLHCAAINPNVSYLTRLLGVEPNINLEDRDHRRPIHFAAVSEGVAPLEFLLQRGASPIEVDNQGMTPLHYACSAGRPRNVDILLKKSKEASAKQGDVFQAKWGPGGVDRPSRSSYCPIHIAISYGHVDVVKILIKHQVDVNKQLSAGKNRVTPLMIAASHGHLDIARILVQNGATIEQPDKLKRTALTHAVMNGNTTVGSYLLYLGADPNKADSSGNTMVHYAAAYGWQYCVKLLLDAGADPKKPNDWKTTAVGIAFLKGHIGMVDYLLNQPGVDIDFKNDEGMTLASVAVSSALEPGLYGQMLYLIDEQKADPRITDANGLDALHHLASNSIRKTEYNKRNEIDEEKMELTVKIAKLLLEAGCDPTCRTKEGRTALMMAIEQVNLKLVKLLVEAGGSVTSHKSDEGKTILHMMAEQCMETDLSEILRILVEQKHEPKANKKEKQRAASEEKPKQQVNSLDHGIKENNIEEGEGGDSKMDVEEAGAKKEQDEKGSGDTKMDVDGEGMDKKEPAENGTVNGMDTETPPPELEKYTDGEAVEESQEDVWPVMAAEVDNEGYTPLLKACFIYRNFKKQSGMKDAAVKICSQNGRNFLKALIELTGADVSATIQEKVFTNDMPIAEKDRYVKDGKCSALHLLVHVGHETMEGANAAALEIVLQHHPNMEHRNLDGKTALVLAVETKEDKALTLLAKAGAHVNLMYHHSFSMGDMTPILVAAKDGHASIVKALIEAKADVQVVNTKTNESPLHFAVQYRDDEPNVVQIVQMLLAAGAEINCGTTTPLHTAVLANLGTSNASTDLEEFLISKGGNVFAKDEKGRLPLHYAFITKAHPESVSPLDPIELCSILTDSMRNKELDVQDENGQTPLHLASMRGATICCVHLLQRGVSLTTRDSDGNTAFSLAVKNKHDSCALMLLQRGASVDDSIVVSNKIPDWKTYHNKKLVWTWKPERLEPQHQVEKYAIYQGAIYGELQGVAHMVLDTSGLTGKAVEAALRVNKYHIALRHLKHIRDARLVSDFTNEEGQNLLHLLALVTTPGKETALQVKVVEVLLERGVSLSQLDKYGRTPLMYAAFRHQPCQLGKLFIEKDPKCDLSKVDIYGRSTMVAFFWDHEKIYEQTKDNTDWIKLLVEAGSSLDFVYQIPVSTTPLFDITIAEYAPDFFKTLENCGSMTPLISAIHHSDFGLTKFLLQNKASSNLADSNGVTPLMHAVRQNDKALVKLLLNNDFTEEETSLTKIGSRSGLRRQLSRQVFTIKPAQHTPEPVPAKDDEADDEEAEDDEAAEEENDEENEEDEDEEGDEENEDDEDMGDEDEEDADTDVVDEEEEEQEAEPLPIPRLGSKQPSMKRLGTSLGSNIDEFPVVEKTSDVNINAADSQGWTAIHHLVSPLEYGTYDNEELLYVLFKAGASINEKDAAGLTPLNRALICGAVKLSQMLQKLQGVELDKQEKPTFLPFRNSAAEEDLSLSSGDMFEADADSMIRKLEGTATQPTPEISKPKPDKYCMVAKVGEVMYDHEQNLPYDVILSKIEVRSLLFDMYNFYKMQIIWHKAKDMYILFTRWGRIGDSGQYQHTPYHKLSDAVTEFGKIFRAKTGNYWSNVKSFQEQPKKYRLVELEQTSKPVVKVNFDLESKIPSKLPAEVQDLLKDMADVGMMEAAMNKAKIAEIFMPFGRIKRDSLVEARKLLQQIGKKCCNLHYAFMVWRLSLGKNNDLTYASLALNPRYAMVALLGEIVVNIEKNRRSGTGFDTAEHQKNCEKIAELSTDFFNLVPLEGYTYDRIHPLNDKGAIKLQMRLISNLLDLEVASKILLGAQYRSAEMNPLDYIYQSVGCSVQPLREDDVESQYILKYIKSSTKHCRTAPKVLNIFKLWREGEEEKQKRLNLGNHKLLWHGSGVANFMSILHRGLLVAPPEAPMTGHAFGEGIYSADTFAKALNYCYNSNPKSDVKLALLCEVALGNVKEDVDSNIEVDLVHSEFNSLHIHGQTVPDHDWDVAVPYGASMPLGCAAKTQWKTPDGKKPWIQFNEYIVQDSEQICLRYLVQFV